MVYKKHSKPVSSPPPLFEGYLWPAIKSLMTIDPKALLYFKPNLDSVYVSFALIFVCLPASIFSFYLTYPPADLKEVIPFTKLAFPLSISFVVSHATYYLVVNLFLNAMVEKRAQFFVYIQLRNILVTIFSILSLFFAILYVFFGFSQEVYLFFVVSLSIYLVYVTWFYNKLAFQISGFASLGFIMFDGVLTFILEVIVVNIAR